MKVKDDRLPNWPELIQLGDGVWGVEGKHITYLRFVFINSASNLLAVPYLIFIIYAVFIHDRNATANEEAFLGAIVKFFILMFIPCLLLNGPMTRLYCRYLWPKKTSASIGPDGVKINGKLYPVEGGDEIQFRASEPYVKPQKLRELEKAINGQRKWIQHADYRVNFRKIEFIYGAKVVLIANVPNDELAQQFVAVLQEAFKRTMNPNAESQSFLSELQGQKANNYLPE